MIRFIIKSVFWLSLAFIFMPQIINSDVDETQRLDAATALPPEEKINRIIDAGQTAAEIGGFCYNNQQLCMTGKNILSATGSGLLDGSTRLIEFLNDQFASDATPNKTQSDTIAPNHEVPLPRHRP